MIRRKTATSIFEAFIKQPKIPTSRILPLIINFQLPLKDNNAKKMLKFSKILANRI